MIFKLLRTKHYIKNIFVLAPCFFAFDFSKESILNSSIAFLLFSITASSIYIFNDILDINEDQNHPEKKYRPIASGKISKSTAYTCFILLGVFSLVASLIFSIAIRQNLNFVGVIFFYFGLNIFYSKWLKHISLVDVFIISLGFVLRIYAGSAATDITLSFWIQLMTFLLALFLAFAKRRDDIILDSTGLSTRKNINGYNLEFINAVMVFLSTIIVICYLQYCISENIMERFRSDKIYLTSIFLILGILRYFQITFVENGSGNPTSVLYKDRIIQLSILFWIISLLLIFIIPVL